MTISEITALRKAGKADEALASCREMFAKYPSDRLWRIAMGKCFKACGEKAAQAGDSNRFVENLEGLASLELHSIGEEAINNRVAWDIKKLFEKIEKNHELICNTAGRILPVVRRMSFIRPDRNYSLLLESFLMVRARFNKPWPRFAELVDWWEISNLMPEDYERKQTDSGKSIPALAERVFDRWVRTLRHKTDRGGGERYRMQTERLIAHLGALDKAHPDYQFTLYHKAQLEMALGRRDDALSSIRPFVKRRQSAFWVWELLGDLSGDPELKLSCLCRALTCHADRRFVGKLRLKAARLMHELGHDGNARAEIRQLRRECEAEGRALPEGVPEMVRQNWYQAAAAPADNLEFYRHHLQPSETFLFSDQPETAILITRNQPERHLCTFISETKRRGFFFTRGLTAPFGENQVYLVRFDGDINDTRASKLLTYRRKAELTEYADIFFRKIDGRLSVKRGFGLIGDIYVSPQLIATDMTEGSKVAGTAVTYFNVKRNEWGWKAASLRISTEQS